MGNFFLLPKISPDYSSFPEFLSNIENSVLDSNFSSFSNDSIFLVFPDFFCFSSLIRYIATSKKSEFLRNRYGMIFLGSLSECRTMRKRCHRYSFFRNTVVDTFERSFYNFPLYEFPRKYSNFLIFLSEETFFDTEFLWEQLSLLRLRSRYEIENPKFVFLSERNLWKRVIKPSKSISEEFFLSLEKRTLSLRKNSDISFYEVYEKDIDNSRASFLTFPCLDKIVDYSTSFFIFSSLERNTITASLILNLFSKNSRCFYYRDEEIYSSRIREYGKKYYTDFSIFLFSSEKYLSSFS